MRTRSASPGSARRSPGWRRRGSRTPTLPRSGARLSALRAEEHEHLALERLEIAEALRDDLEHDPVVAASVLVDQEIAQSFHAPERVGHRLGYRLAAGELFEQIVFLTRESEAHPPD